MTYSKNSKSVHTKQQIGLRIMDIAIFLMQIVNMKVLLTYDSMWQGCGCC